LHSKKLWERDVVYFRHRQKQAEGHGGYCWSRMFPLPVQAHWTHFSFFFKTNEFNAFTAFWRGIEKNYIHLPGAAFTIRIIPATAQSSFFFLAFFPWQRKIKTILQKRLVALTDIIAKIRCGCKGFLTVFRNCFSVMA